MFTFIKTKYVTNTDTLITRKEKINKYKFVLDFE